MGDRDRATARMRKSGGEIVEVEGGHIVRSTGRKDRHSKVCTAKGPRDRRVRLAAHTAIQFYDVQDRLGYDRPSKAVDWLIAKAKAAIDDLALLPPWHPTADRHDHDSPHHHHHHHHHHRQFGVDSSLLPPSLDSDAIADTIKSFFPTGGEATQFHSFPPPDLPPRNAAGSEDLRLSLQSFPDPALHHHNEETPTQVLLSGGLDDWPEHHHFPRLAAWNSGGGDAYLFNLPLPPPPQQPMLQQLLGQNQFVSQRGPLQSSNTSSIRAWMDPIAAADHHNASSISGIGGFSGFHIPARIQGDDEEHDGYSDKPSSASSDSRH